MRKIRVLNRISIDGYFASNNQKTFGMDWFVQDPEIEKAAHRISGGSDTLLLGATTFRGFEKAWLPVSNDPKAPRDKQKVARELTGMTKVVFSTSLTESEWENTEFHAHNLVSVVRKLKKAKGGDILLMGSGTIAQQLAKAGLIDEYVLVESPVIAGGGKPLFSGAPKPRGLKLLSAKRFESGNVLVHYEVVR